MNVAMVIDRFSLPRLALRIRHVTAGILGLLAAWCLAGGFESLGILSGYWLAGLVMVPAVIVIARFLRRGIPIEFLFTVRLRRSRSGSIYYSVGAPDRFWDA